MDETMVLQREEHKYLADMATALRLRAAIGRVLQPDVHNVATGGYMIRSLYFDTQDGRDYMEKMAGVARRKKLRLRIYDTRGTTCKLECKEKEGGYSRKTSLTLSREEAERVADADYTVLRTRGAEDGGTAMRFYSLLTRGCYRPAVLCEYRREAYVYPASDTRVTFDYDLRSNEAGEALYAENPLYIPLLPGRVVVEVKHTGTLPRFIASLLQTGHLREESFSKYCRGRAQFLALL